MIIVNKLVNELNNNNNNNSIMVPVGDFEVAKVNRCLEHCSEKNRCCEGYSNINCKDNVETTHC